MQSNIDLCGTVDLLHTYSLGENSDRVAPAAENRAHFHFSSKIYLPTLLLPRTWDRFGYSEEDVRRTFEAMDPWYTWVTSFVLDPDFCFTRLGTHSRPSFSSIYQFSFIADQTLVDRLLDLYPRNSTEPILCLERSDHVPPIPVVQSGVDRFRQVQAALPDLTPQFDSAPARYAAAFEFKGAQFVPVSSDETGILMVRVVSKQEYENFQFEKTLVTLPVTVHVADEVCILHEEAFFLTSRSCQP
jgi:hypothetical protein